MLAEFFTNIGGRIGGLLYSSTVRASTLGSTGIAAIAYVTGVVNDWFLMLVLSLGIVIFLCAVYIVLQVLFRYPMTPRAWACLDTRTGDSLDRRFFDAAAGGKGSDDIHFVPSGGDGMSLAMSADGSLLASISGSRLLVSTMNASSGSRQSWGNPVHIEIKGVNDYSDLQVLAIARKGDLEVVCAIACQSKTRLATFGFVERPRRGDADVRWRDPAWEPAGDFPKGQHPYAAFLGARLLYVYDGSVREVLPETEYEDNPPKWVPPNWTCGDTDEVIAMDASVVGGRTYVALLVKDSRTEREDGGGPRAGVDKPGTRLIVVPMDDESESKQINLVKPAHHVSVVRAPYESAERVCVLAAMGRALKPYHPFGTSGLEPAEGTIAGKQWPRRSPHDDSCSGRETRAGCE